MTTVGFEVLAHTMFRVGSAYARDGVDVAVDHDDPLPADHLKGVMRASAGRLLGPSHPLVGAVFGTAARPSPWAWTSAAPQGRWVFGHRHRVAIDPQTHTAVKDLLVLGEQAWVRADGVPGEHGRAWFEVHRTRHIDPGRDGSGDDNQAGDENGAGYDEAAQVTLLRCAAAGVHALGAWRRRGLGWVQVTPRDGAVDPADVQRLLRWREAGR